MVTPIFEGLIGKLRKKAISPENATPQYRYLRAWVQLKKQLKLRKTAEKQRMIITETLQKYVVLLF